MIPCSLAGGNWGRGDYWTGQPGGCLGHSHVTKWVSAALEGKNECVQNHEFYSEW